MCTLILASRLLDDTPLLFASNRDELRSRPASGPTIWADRTPRIVAPRDEQEGGTWLGVNEHGLVVAITNRAGANRDATRLSRGELVLRALDHRTPAAAATDISQLTAARYNPFHLLMASRDDARVVWSNGATMREIAYEPGIIVLTERSFDAAPNERATRVTARVAELRDAGDLRREALQEVLSVHVEDDIDATCVSLNEWNYGTRSSATIELGARTHMTYAPGPPCEVAYDDVTPLLTSLLGSSR